jgi:hypothetical protein
MRTRTLSLLESRPTKLKRIYNSYILINVINLYIIVYGIK